MMNVVSIGLRALVRFGIAALLASCTIVVFSPSVAAQSSGAAVGATSADGTAIQAEKNDGSQAVDPYFSGLPYRPKNGDKLGYSREESARRLSPEIRAFLDAILRLYHEPGLFSRRREVFALLGTESGRREALSHSIPRTSTTDLFREYAMPIGLFSRDGWSAIYTYWGREDKDERWRIRLDIRIPQTDCIDSRAVEGYLDLYLYTGLEGLIHPPLPAHWDRHGVAGRPFARPISSATPGISLGFLRGCTVEFTLSNSYKFKEVSDDNVLN